MLRSPIQPQIGDAPLPIQLDQEGQRILDVVNAIIAVWRVVQNPKLTREENLDLVKQAKVAKQLGLGDEDAPEGSSALSSRLRRYSVKEMFPGVWSWFKAFVKVVVKGYEQGEAPEATVLNLLRRLNPAARATLRAA
jgi:hypothetical protein